MIDPVTHGYATRSSVRRGPAGQCAIGVRGGPRFLGHAVSAIAAVVALAGLKVLAPTLTRTPMTVAVAPTISRPEPSALTAQGPSASANADGVPPIVLSDVDRSLLAEFSGSWWSGADEIVIDGTTASMRASKQSKLSGKVLRIRQVTYPFMIAEHDTARYTILLKEKGFMIYNTSLFPPIEYQRK